MPSSKAAQTIKRIWTATMKDQAERPPTPKLIEEAGDLILAAAIRDGIRPTEAAIAFLECVWNSCAQAKSAPSALQAALRAVCRQRHFDSHELDVLQREIGRRFVGAAEVLLRIRQNPKDESPR